MIRKSVGRTLSGPAKWIVSALLTGLLLAAPVAAQSVAALLQKGIYTQETVGDVDGAIEIYKRILSRVPLPPDLAVEARVRLAQSFLQEGNAQGAAMTIVNLTRDFPDREDLQDRIGPLFRQALTQIGAGQVGSPRDAGVAPLGVVKDGRYHHLQTGVEFAVPPGWSVQSTGPSSDGGDQMYLGDSLSVGTYVAVWMKKESNPASDLDAMLQFAPVEKTNQRGAQVYRVRAGSIEQRSIGGRKAVSAVADFIGDGLKKVEYNTWIYTENTRAYFHAQCAASDLPLVQARVDAIIRTAIVP